jgi:hypothetical protein
MTPHLALLHCARGSDILLGREKRFSEAFMRYKRL